MSRHIRAQARPCHSAADDQRDLLGWLNRGAGPKLDLPPMMELAFVIKVGVGAIGTGAVAWKGVERGCGSHLPIRMSQNSAENSGGG